MESFLEHGTNTETQKENLELLKRRLEEKLRRTSSGYHILSTTRSGSRRIWKVEHSRILECRREEADLRGKYPQWHKNAGKWVAIFSRERNR